MRSEPRARWIFWCLLGLWVVAPLAAQTAPGASGMAPGAPLDDVPADGALGTGGGMAGPGAAAVIAQGNAMLAEGRFTEAREAFRTAIRLEPMNPSHWNRYDEAVERLFVERRRQETENPVIEADLAPMFSIDKVEAYHSMGRLYLVGEVRNLTRTHKRMVEVVGILYDQDRVELRRAAAYMMFKERGIYPNEAAPFEIAFRDPPPGIKSYRVQVIASH